MITKTRETSETQITIALDIHGSCDIQINTGLDFFDHMLNQLAFHAGWDLHIMATSDDQHHLIEDVALVLGDALYDAWQNLQGCDRYGHCVLPMDETLVLAAVDLSGRPYARTQLGIKREMVSGMETEMVPHFFYSLAMKAQCTLHIKKLRGRNHHHIIEAGFKAVARAFRQALTTTTTVASTKGSL